MQSPSKLLRGSSDWLPKSGLFSLTMTVMEEIAALPPDYHHNANNMLKYKNTQTPL